MKTISRYLLTLVALFAMTTGAWANIATIEFTKETVPGSWKNNFTPISPDYLPDFKPATDAEAIAWDGASKTNRTILIYGFDGEKVKYVTFYTTGGYQTRNEISSLYDFYEQVMENDCIVCYTTFAVFLNDTKTEASFDMPTYDLTVDYEVVRDMGYAIVASVCNDAERIRVQKVNGKYQPVEALTYTLTDYIGGLDNPVTLTMGTDYTIAGMHILDSDGSTWKDVTDMEDLVPGTYEVIFAGMGNYDDKAYSQEFEIYAKNIITQPTAIPELVYNGQQQPLVTAAECEGGEMRYSLDGENWSADVPTGLNAGTYTVYYKVIADENDTDPDYQTIENITIDKAELSTVTLEQSVLIYDTYYHQPQTVVITKVNAGEVEVPADDYTVEGDTYTDMGNYTVTVTAKETSKNFKGEATADWSIVEEVILVDENNVPVLVTADPDAKTLTIDKILAPKTGNIVHLPAEINGYQVTAIGANAMSAETGVTDIYMPDTEEPIDVAEGALPDIAIIHTTLPLLDDYALMLGLKPNFEARKVMTTVTPKNLTWTLSSGVDIILPEGVVPSRVELIDEATVGLDLLTAEQLDMDGEKVLKACNGVLMTSAAGQDYDLVARPGRQESGSAVSTTDVKDYGTNLLEAIVETKHVTPSDYYVLKNNRFKAIEENDSKVPACKAVLKKPDGMNLARVLNIDLGEAVTGIATTDYTDSTDSVWYDLNGRKLDSKPTKKGLYIKNGRKVVVK